MTVLSRGLRVDDFLLVPLAEADGPVVSEPGHLPQAVGHIAAVGVRAGRGGAASRSAVKKQTLAGRFDGEN
ncbi:hypothetical protein EZ440_18370 [Salmonella enterica]|nr:hypothetical protein [Salmonella enterica]